MMMDRIQGSEIVDAKEIGAKIGLEQARNRLPIGGDALCTARVCFT